MQMSKLKPIGIAVCGTFVVFAGAAFGSHLIKHNDDPLPRPTIARMTSWDGRWYHDLSEGGYSFERDRASNVAFMPLYPILTRLVRCIGVSTDVALLIVSNGCFLMSVCLLATYVNRRHEVTADTVQQFVLFSVALLPNTFFFRMAYSESLFLLLAIASLYCLEAKYPLVLSCAVIGLATASRVVGLSLLAPLILHLIEVSSSLRQLSIRVVIYLPLACWGLLAYMGYLTLEFGNPLAFSETQQHWQLRPTVPVVDKIWHLIEGEPIWGVFNEECDCAWTRQPDQPFWLFNLHLANPIYFGSSAILVYVGAFRTWLSNRETALSVALLLIPYLTRGHEMCMAGTARFAAVAFPVYIVLGQLFARLPSWAAYSVLCISSFLLGTYAAMFAAGYPFF